MKIYLCIKLTPDGIETVYIRAFNWLDAHMIACDRELHLEHEVVGISMDELDFGE